MNRHYLPPLVTLVAYIRAALTVAPNGQPTLVYGIGQVSPLRARRAALTYWRSTRIGHLDHGPALDHAATVMVPGFLALHGYDALAARAATESFLARVADQAARDLHPAGVKAPIAA